jgi:hypothetical protein
MKTFHYKYVVTGFVSAETFEEAIKIAQLQVENFIFALKKGSIPPPQSLIEIEMDLVRGARLTKMGIINYSHKQIISYTYSFEIIKTIKNKNLSDD